MQRLFAFVTGIDPKLALRLGAVVVAAALVLIFFDTARESGREAEAIETREETAETVQNLEETYEQIEESRADNGDDVVVERLRDGTFLTGDTGSEADLPAD